MGWDLVAFGVSFGGFVCMSGRLFGFGFVDAGLDGWCGLFYC